MAKKNLIIIYKEILIKNKAKKNLLNLAIYI